MMTQHSLKPFRNKSVLLVLIAIFPFLPCSCTLPPDILPSPIPGPPATIARDASLSGEAAIPSSILDSAEENPHLHSAILLEYGDDALMARIHLIRAARTSIDIQTFIWIYDRSGKWIYRELLKAARRGVKVRILVDQFMAPGIPVNEYAALVTAHENLEIRLYQPLTINAINTAWGTLQNTFTRYSTMNRRMHNKIFLVDGTVAIVGGRNVQDAYFDRDPRLTFRDRDVIISGPATRDITRSFTTFWEHEKCYEASRMQDLKTSIENGSAAMSPSFVDALHPDLLEIDEVANLNDFSLIRPHLKNYTVADITFMSDHPLKTVSNQSHRSPFKEATRAIKHAKTEILIQTPYAVLDNRIYKNWKNLRRNSSVRMRFSTNSLASADHVYVGSIALKHRRKQVNGLGIELYLARPVPGDIRQLVPRYDRLLHESVQLSHPNWNSSEAIMPIELEGPRFCIHAKSMVIDQKISLVGSHNFDPRSDNLNTECLVMITGEAFTGAIADHINLSFENANSWVVAERDVAPVISDVNNLISYISTSLPVLDIWPIEHISCYELKDGRKPLSPYDENFHEHYRDVGPFPGLDIGLDPIKVRLIRAIGGPAASIM